ncbi:unnamed protein product [Microthlaspi erraticum]|uniref:Uncharacterized protein n=1 Tax=Microthlaspi erraticum TaxID=1685480 RepID=A0A6D2K5A4_9BRAS|nr:unnamed protein product [Microthlaspi erraticum]
MGKVVVAGRNPSRIEKKKRKRETMVEKMMKKKTKRETMLEKKMKKKRNRETMLEKKMKKREKEVREQEDREKRMNEFNRQKWNRAAQWEGFHFNGFKLTTIHEYPNDTPIVRLYAKIGLHRYNMLEGTNLQLRSIKKHFRKAWMFWLPPSYYITLEAENPDTGSIVPFQISSHERKKDKLDVRFIVARPGTNVDTFIDPTAPRFLNVSVPKWPSENDQRQLYLVQESELKENDWIRLYLELGFVSTNRLNLDLKLSDLKIVEVMVETKEDVEQPNERLKGFINATFYIKYDQDLGEGQVCKRRAIIRRDVDLRTQRMSLQGDDYLDIETDDSVQQHEASQ